MSKTRSKLASFTRRSFLVGSLAVTGGVVFGYWKYKQPHDNPLLNNAGEDEAVLTPYILINKEGITIFSPRAEMGQGVYTTLASMVAEELDIELEQAKVVHSPASNVYYNAAVLEEGIPFAHTDMSKIAENIRKFLDVPAKLYGLQITGGSSSVADAFEKMRYAGAVARQTLILAAAKKWNINANNIKTNKGQTISPDGDTLSYQDLAISTSSIEPPLDVELKPKSEWKLLGKSQQRVDVVEKSTGTATFGIDTELPNMLYATVKMNPHLGGKMNSFDASQAQDLKGVEQIIELDNGVAVIASNTWYALRAANAIKFDWGDAPYPKNSKEIEAQVKNAFDKKHQNSRLKDNGNVDQALKNADPKDIIEAEYQVPYLAHAPMEPMNATAWLNGDKLEIWAGTQIPTQAVKEAAEITGLDASNITLHTPILGGGFGRRLEVDFVKQAVKIAKTLPGKPIKLTWSREEDMTHDFYRPMAVSRFKALINQDGSNAAPNTVDFKTTSSSVNASQLGRIGIPASGPDTSIVQAAWDQPYNIENYRVTGYKAQEALPVSSWRSVGASQNAFFHESMLDEIAHAKQLDPMQMRLNLIEHQPSREVLEAVKTMSDWGKPLPEGHFQGLAFCMSFGVPAAEVVRIKMEGRKVKLVKVFAAVDVGIALDPRNIEAQVTGGINFGLAAAMTAEITVKDGKVEQTNFHNYTSLRINQAPDVEVKILENGPKIRGIGEPGTPPIAPALTNAIFLATGQRIRKLPINELIQFA